MLTVCVCDQVDVPSTAVAQPYLARRILGHAEVQLTPRETRPWLSVHPSGTFWGGKRRGHALEDVSHRRTIYCVAAGEGALNGNDFFDRILPARLPPG